MIPKKTAKSFTFKVAITLRVMIPERKQRSHSLQGNHHAPSLRLPKKQESPPGYSLRGPEISMPDRSKAMALLPLVPTITASMIGLSIGEAALHSIKKLAPAHPTAIPTLDWKFDGSAAEITGWVDTKYFFRELPAVSKYSINIMYSGALQSVLRMLNVASREVGRSSLIIYAGIRWAHKPIAFSARVVISVLPTP